VGDAAKTLEGLPGCAVTRHDAREIAAAVVRILSSPCRGRSDEADARRRARVFELGLDEESIARRLLHIYRDVARGAARAR
jgi:hypothetical protein